MLEISNAKHEHILKQSGLQNKRLNANNFTLDGVDFRAIIDAFMESDLEQLIKLYCNYPGAPWYKVLGLGNIEVLNPSQAHIMSQIIRRKLSLLWGKVEIEENEILDKFKLYEIENYVQRYGEIVIKIVYENNKPELEIVTRNYKQHEDHLELFYFYKLDNHIRIKLVEKYFNDNTVERELYEQVDGESFIQVSLNKYSSFFGMELQDFEKLEHQTVFTFTNERNLLQVVSHANTLDMLNTNIDWITRTGKPLLVISKDVALKDGNIDKTNAIEIMSDSYNFTVEQYEDTESQNKISPIQMISPEIQKTLDPYQKVKETIAIECANIMGLSATSLGSNFTQVSASASAESLQEREKLTQDTKTHERNLRLAQLKQVFDALGLSVEISTNDEEDELDIQTVLGYQQMLKDQTISFETFCAKVFPNWTPTDIAKERQRLRIAQATGGM